MLTTFWESLSPVHTNIFGLFFTLVSGFIFYIFRSRVKLIYGSANNSRNVLFTPDVNDQSKNFPNQIYVEKFFLQNLGRITATNVEFVLSHFPTDITIFEPRETEVKAVEKGNCLIKIPQIAPGELVIIDCLYINQNAAFVSSVKCSERIGRVVPFQTQRDFGRIIEGMAGILMLLGIAFVVQTLMALV